jgi:hypothetical protein
LPLGASPPARDTPQPGDWTPFDSKAQFEIANLLYHRAEASASNIDSLFEIWARSVHEFDALAPFKDHNDMYLTINSSVLRDVPWQCMVTNVPKDVDERVASWMCTSYKV